MKIIYQPSIEEIRDLLYSEGIKIKEIYIREGTMSIWVHDDHVKTIFNLFSKRYTLLKMMCTGLSGNTFIRIQVQKKHKWF